MRIYVVDLPDYGARLSFKPGADEAELWVSSTLAADPEELRKVHQWAEEEWERRSHFCKGGVLNE